MNFQRRLFDASLAYGVTAIVQIAGLLYLLKFETSQLVVTVLQFLFISQLLAGIEPGTAKAFLLRRNTKLDLRLPTIAVVGIPLVKAAIITPLIALIWLKVNDGPLSWQIFYWTALLATLGFITTEMRTVFDVHGRPGLAIWLKQGGLAVGTIGLMGAIALGYEWESAAALHIGLRLGWAFSFYCLAKPLMRTPLASESIWGKHWRDSKWIDIASVSVLAAASGSLDRIFAFQFLTPQDVSRYVFTYEVFSKLWFVPYVIAPMVFADFVSSRDGRRILNIGMLVVSVLSLGAFTVTALCLIYANSIIVNMIGFKPIFWPTLAFLLAVSTAGLTQLILAALQGMGGTRAATIALIAGFALTVPTFWLATKLYGLTGLYFAWLFKSILELILALFFIRREYNREI